jgi:hypothetical protein
MRAVHGSRATFGRVSRVPSGQATLMLAPAHARKAERDMQLPVWLSAKRTAAFRLELGNPLSQESSRC